MIELYSTPTPNGQKVMIMLEETGVPWKHIDVNIRTGEQFSQEHLKRSPNNKIPAIVDTEGPNGKPYTMMESGAILIYLAEKTGKFMSKDMRKKYGFAELGPADGLVKRAILGETSAKMYRYDVKKAAWRDDRFAALKDAHDYDGLGNAARGRRAAQE